MSDVESRDEIIVIGRKMIMVGGISESMLQSFCAHLAVLEGKSKQPIILELSSPGGNAYDALAFAARIRTSSCVISVCAYGLVASAAVLVLAAGKKRLMSKEAWVMVHEDSGSIDGNTTDTRKWAAHMERLEYQWADLLSEMTKTSATKWRGLHNQTKYLTADECLELGLVDEIF